VPSSKLLLVLDAGNTNITFGLFSGPLLLHTFRAETRLERSADEYAVFVRQVLSAYPVSSGQVTRAIIASVVPRLTPTLIGAVRLSLGCEALVVNTALRLGIVLQVPNVERVGVDRVVNAVAARERALEAAGAAHPDSILERGVIVVDLGTATTFDCVSPRGEFLGGAIAPGVRVSLDGLIRRTAQLPTIDLVAPKHAIGQTTIECLQSGLVYGYAGLVDGLLGRLQAELQFDCDVIATGGLAAIIAPHTQRMRVVDPELTLRGLYLLDARNRHPLA
jgi:type III pantothenate kinase